MLTRLVYPIIFWAILLPTAGFLLLVLIRFIANYTDPNPFGMIGRLVFRIKKLTDPYVYPAARFLAGFGVNTKLAPLLTMFITAIAAYFAIQMIGIAFFIVDGLVASSLAGNVKAIIGFILYAALSVYVLFILIRFVAMWFVQGSNRFLRFVYKVTEPILAPARRLIPPVRMFDISAMLVLILIMLLQTVVLRLFVYS